MKTRKEQQSVMLFKLHRKGSEGEWRGRMQTKKYKSITENKSENTAKYDFNIERRDNTETQS